MLDLKFIKNNKEIIEDIVEKRNLKIDLDRFYNLLESRNKLIADLDSLKAERNVLSKKIAHCHSPEEREQLIAHVSDLKMKIKEQEELLNKQEKEFKELWLRIPNLLDPSVPIGKDDNENQEIYRSVEKVEFDFPVKDHTELLGEDLLDFERGAKVTASKFYFLKNDLALLEQALIQYTIDLLINKYGFEFFTVPDLARNEIILGTGFNPRGEEKQIYNIEESDLSLIGTAEIVLAGYHQGEVLKKEDLPKKYLALSHCFRTEAGAYGRTSKGLYRVHQFSKLEMFIYSSQEEANKYLDYLKEIEMDIFNQLEIPFRVVNICSGDLGAPAYKKYDLEAWMTMKRNDENEFGDWGEVTSCSNCTDYQARRLNIKYDDNGEKKFVYTLNGTAISLARAIIALVENHQEADGSIKIPKVLEKYFPKPQIKSKNIK